MKSYVKSLDSYKLCGLLLFGGMLLTFLSGVLAPGQGIVAPVTPSSDLESFMQGRLDAKVDNDEWAHITAIGYVAGHLAMLGGIAALWPSRLRRSPATALTRAGLLAISVGAAAGVAGALGDMTMVEVIKYGRTPGIADQDYFGYAQVVNIFDVAFDYVILLTVFAGYLMLACGLALRFGAGRRRKAHLGIALISGLGLLLAFLGYHFPDSSMVQTAAGLLVVTTGWLMVLGVWIYKEDEQLLGDSKAD
ncbi:MAG: hypothetical protein OXG55_09280 [bacterium]|nr:hypothetical protein [bacterium]